MIFYVNGLIIDLSKLKLKKVYQNPQSLQRNQVTCKINPAQETSLKVAKGKESSKIVSELSNPPRNQTL